MSQQCIMSRHRWSGASCLQCSNHTFPFWPLCVSSHATQGSKSCMRVWLYVVQAFAIIGAFVGGWLARQRRLELENTNRKLRHINTELRRRQTEVQNPHNAVAYQLYSCSPCVAKLACSKQVHIMLVSLSS